MTTRTFKDLEVRIDPRRPMEPLIGNNRGIVRQKLARVHCCRPWRYVAREIRPANWRQVPPALRRGLLLCIVETLREYRTLFVDVQQGRVGE